MPQTLRLQDLIAAWEVELREQSRVAKRSSERVEAIELLDPGPPVWLYRLRLRFEIFAHSDQVVSILVDDRVYAGVVVASDDQGLIVAFAERLPDATNVRYTTSPTFITRRLIDLLKTGVAENPLVKLILRGATEPTGESDAAGLICSAAQDLNLSQRSACLAVLKYRVGMIWGPPGTGKTHTLGRLVAALAQSGATVLVAAISNAAVDVAAESIRRCLPESLRASLLRLGGVANPTVDSDVNDRKRESLLKQIEIFNTRRVTRSPELDRLKRELEELGSGERAPAGGRIGGGHAALDSARVVATTLAKVAIDQRVRARRFDVVILDEASMAGMAWVLAAASLATRQFIAAGDPMQLPPVVICSHEAQYRILGTNIFTHYQTESNPDAQHVGFLDTQFRMVPRIGEVISRVFYGGRLKHARRDGSDVKPLFIEMDVGYAAQNWYSVSSSSYYNPAIIGLLQALWSREQAIVGARAMVLTPFRPQQRLIAATLDDIGPRASGARALTIHRSQGQESDLVVMDFTAVSPAKLQAFFADRHAMNLVNVAMSRARDRLVLLGTKRFIQRVAEEGDVRGRRAFGLLASIVADEFETLSARELLTMALIRDPGDWIAQHCRGAGGLRSAVLVQGDSASFRSEHLGTLGSARYPMRMAVWRRPVSPVPTGVTLVHDAPGVVPAFASVGGKLLLSADAAWSVWAAIESPVAAGFLVQAATSHWLADASPEDVEKLNCPHCSGPLSVEPERSGVFVVCNGGTEGACRYRRRLTKLDATRLASVFGLACPECESALIGRASREGSIFLGCSNYTHGCRGSRALHELTG